MDNANGQYAYHHTNEHGNAILHGSFDQERHGTGNGSAPNPLQNTPNGTLPPIPAAHEAYLQGVITNPNPQMLAPRFHQSTFQFPQTWDNATSHSATQASGGFGSTHGGSPYDQRTTAGYGGFTPGGVQPLGQIGGFAALSRASQSQQYDTAQYNQSGAAGFAHVDA